MTKLPPNWADLRRDWAILSIYQRFEAAVALLLTAIISIIILAALYRLVVNLIDTLVRRAMNPLDHAVFQEVFGGILTALIALEFNHTLQYSISRERGIIHVRVVILIALLALARKIIVTELYEVPAATLAAIAALALSLGVTYWLIREAKDGPEAVTGPG